MRIARLRRHLTYANVCATLALFVALTGGIAWAATELAPKSVKAKHIATGAVGSPQIKNGSVGAIDLQPKLRRTLGVTATGAPGGTGATGATGPRGPAGPPGAPGAPGQDLAFRGERIGGVLLRIAATPIGSPGAYTTLGSVGPFVFEGRCLDGSTYVQPDLLMRPTSQAAVGTMVSGGSAAPGWHRFASTSAYSIIGATGPNSLGYRAISGGTTKLLPAGVTVLLPDGRLFDVRLMVASQLSGQAISPVAVGAACGFTLVGVEEAQR